MNFEIAKRIRYLYCCNNSNTQIAIVIKQEFDYSTTGNGLNSIGFNLIKEARKFFNESVDDWQYRKSNFNYNTSVQHD